MPGTESRCLASCDAGIVTLILQVGEGQITCPEPQLWTEAGFVHPKSDAQAFPQLGLGWERKGMPPAGVTQEGLREKPVSQLGHLWVLGIPIAQ